MKLFCTRTMTNEFSAQEQFQRRVLITRTMAEVGAKQKNNANEAAKHKNIAK